MANVKQLKHLEHLEDEMLNYGVEGCKAAVSFLKELRKMLGCDNSTGFMQTKWDGAPSVICGTDPNSGLFFVGTKSVFAKTPKICYTDVDVDLYYEGDLAEKLKYSLKYFSGLGIKGIVQGDLLFTKSTLRTETVHGERLYMKWKRPSDSDYQFNKNEIWSVSPASIPHKLDVVYNLNSNLDKSKFSSKLEYDNGTVNGSTTSILGTSGQVSYNDDGAGIYTTQVNTGNKKATTTGGSVEWIVVYDYDNTNNRYRVGIDSREFTNQQPDWDKVTKLKLFDLWDGSVTPKSGNNNADTHWNEYWIYTDTELDWSNSSFSSFNSNFKVNCFSFVLINV